MKKPPTPIGPAPSIRRLPRYLDYLRGLESERQRHVSCTEIATAFGQTAIQVRKDLAICSITGRPRVGYPVPALAAAIRAFLGWDNASEAFLVGSGHLGLALLGYAGFSNIGLNITAAFDSDRRKIGSHHHGQVIHDISLLPEMARRMQVHIAVLTVPRERAQYVCDLLVGAGIKAIWNFSDPQLQTPDDVIVETVQLSASLAMLSSRLQAQSHSPT